MIRDVIAPAGRIAAVAGDYVPTVALLGRRYVGCEIMEERAYRARRRIALALEIENARKPIVAERWCEVLAELRALEDCPFSEESGGRLSV